MKWWGKKCFSSRKYIITKKPKQGPVFIVTDRHRPPCGHNNMIHKDFFSWGGRRELPERIGGEGKRNVEGSTRVHPTQKPAGLYAFCINIYSDAEDLIVDLFLGSGSALIAAEQLGRICYGMEIDPVYCDVICNRWKIFTGKKPILQQK